MNPFGAAGGAREAAKDWGSFFAPPADGIQRRRRAFRGFGAAGAVRRTPRCGGLWNAEILAQDREKARGK